MSRRFQSLEAGRHNEDRPLSPDSQASIGKIAFCAGSPDEQQAHYGSKEKRFSRQSSAFRPTGTIAGGSWSSGNASACFTAPSSGSGTAAGEDRLGAACEVLIQELAHDFVERLRLFVVREMAAPVDERYA
jgi:hypothetical protein